MSTGSTGVVKVDLLKSPIFQTTSVIVKPTSALPAISANTNIGKEENQPKLTFLSVYTGAHTYVEGSTTKTAAIKIVSNNNIEYCCWW